MKRASVIVWLLVALGVVVMVLGGITMEGGLIVLGLVVTVLGQMVNLGINILLSLRSPRDPEGKFPS